MGRLRPSTKPKTSIKVRSLLRIIEKNFVIFSLDDHSFLAVESWQRNRCGQAIHRSKEYNTHPCVIANMEEKCFYLQVEFIQTQCRQTKHILITKSFCSLSWPNSVECRYQDFKGRAIDVQVQHESLVSTTLQEFLQWVIAAQERVLSYVHRSRFSLPWTIMNSHNSSTFLYQLD